MEIKHKYIYQPKTGEKTVSKKDKAKINNKISSLKTNKKPKFKKKVSNKNKKDLKKITDNSNQKYIRKGFAYILATGAISLLSYFLYIFTFSNINEIWKKVKKDEVLYKDSIILTKPSISIDQEYTKRDNVIITGKANTGTTVILYKDSQKINQTLVNAEGKYNFNNVKVNSINGAKTIYFTKAQKDENTLSEPSKSVTVIYDNSKPKIDIKYPEDKQKIEQSIDAVTITGSTEKNAEITINGKKAVVDDNGIFKLRINLKEGETKLEFKSTDPAGNFEEKEITVELKKI